MVIAAVSVYGQVASVEMLPDAINKSGSTNTDP